MPYIEELRVKRGVLMIFSSLQDSMDHIIAILIIYKLIQRSKANIYESSLNVRIFEV
jgi:hypothetical protein